jgi:molybdate transport system regulatory protein
MPRIRLLIAADTALGPGKVALLEAVARSGSISAAARELGMSYRRAWMLVDSINRAFDAPLVATATGGKGGGGAQVTELGHEVLRRYRQMEDKAAAAIADDLAEFGRLMRSTHD